MYKLKLYITGHTPTGDALIGKLREMFETNCGGNFSLEVLDVFEHPEAAFEDMVLATPTLIKVLPPPARRIVGDLSNFERVLAGLKLIEKPDTPDAKATE